MRPTVLVTTPYLRHPAEGGYLLGIENSIKALTRIATVHVHSREGLSRPEQVPTVRYYQGLCQGLHMARPRPAAANPGMAQRALNSIARRAFGRDLLHARHAAARAREDCAAILRVATQINPDVIWLSFGALSFALVRRVTASAPCKVVLQTDGVYSRSILRGLPFARSEPARLWVATQGKIKLQEERWGTPLVDVVTAVSPIEVEYYRGLMPSPDKVHPFSNAIDLEMYRAVPPPRADLRRPSICLAGAFWHDDSPLGGSPMEDAARWVVRDVLPLVRQHIPGIHLYIVGANSDNVVGDVAGPDVTITGTLPSVLGYLCHADVALVPLRFGSGTRFKILEAGACGIPVVSTTLGAEGLPVGHAEHMLIADSPEGSAASIVRLLTDPDLARRLARNLKTLVAARFSIPALAQEGRRILRYLRVTDDEAIE